MVAFSIVLIVIGMCLELAGLLGAGMDWTWGGIVLILAGGIAWGLSGKDSSRG